MDKNTTYYGVLMNRSLIFSGVYLFRPVCLLEGDIDTSSKEGTFFVDNTGSAYYMSTDGNSLNYDGVDTVAYVISKEELIATNSQGSIECATEAYFSEISSKAHIGYYIYNDNVIDIKRYDFELIRKELNTNDGSETSIELDLSGMSVEDQENIYKTLQSYNDDIVALPLYELENILKQTNYEDMKRVLQGIFDNMVEYDATQKSSQSLSSNQTYSLDLNAKSGADIIHLFNESYRAFLSINDMDEMKKVISDLIDMYTELYLDMDIPGKYDDVEAARDFLVTMVDDYENMLKLDNLDDIKSKIVELREKERRNILQVAAIYDERKIAENAIKESQTQKEEVVSDKKIIDINAMKEYLDRHVIGQEEAKRTVIQTVYMNQFIDNHEDKLSCLLIGPTGSGKTLILKRIGEYLDIPTLIIDTTQITIEGYVGNKIENFLSMLLTKTNGDLSAAEESVVILDELDKKGSANNSDVSGKGVLNSLLPFIDGTTYEVTYKNRPVIFNTSKLTIFATGAFTDVIREKNEKGYSSGTCGFNSSINSSKEDIVYDKITIDDLVKYGLMPRELMGRFAKITQLSGHTIDTLKEILLSETGILENFKRVLENIGVELTWTGDYVDAIAAKALNLKTGARSLKSSVEDSLTNARWEALINNMQCKIILTGETVIDNNKYIIETKEIEKPKMMVKERGKI